MVSLDQAQLYDFATEVSIFLVIIFITALIAHISKTIISRTLRSTSPFLAARIRRYVFLLIWAVGVIFALGQVGISLWLLILLVGLVGIGFIASAYPVLQNFISRSFLGPQYRVGDMISIGGSGGKVIEITGLNTVLLDEEGNLVTVPNMLFQKEIWTKLQVSGYELTVPFVIKKEIDAVAFEKALLASLAGMKKYFNKAPSIVTSKTGEKTTELSLILNLKDPEQKNLVVTEVNEKVHNQIAECTQRTEETKKEAKLKEIKDIGT